MVTRLQCGAERAQAFHIPTKEALLRDHYQPVFVPAARMGENVTRAPHLPRQGQTSYPLLRQLRRARRLAAHDDPVDRLVMTRMPMEACATTYLLHRATGMHRGRISIRPRLRLGARRVDLSRRLRILLHHRMSLWRQLTSSETHSMTMAVRLGSLSISQLQSNRALLPPKARIRVGD